MHAYSWSNTQDIQLAAALGYLCLSYGPPARNNNASHTHTTNRPGFDELEVWIQDRH